jgi:RNA polymerase sigma factor (sigma-70 family)
MGSSVGVEVALGHGAGGNRTDASNDYLMMADFDELDVAELFGLHGAALVRRARGLVRSEADAEDAVQDTMLAILDAPHLLSVIENVGGWLYTLVQRRCVDILRRETVRRSDERGGGLQALFEEALDDATERLERQELMTAVANAVRHLDEPLRFALVENELEGRTFKELSAQSGIPMGTLMARKQRAVEVVRNELHQRGFISRDAEDEEENEP